MPDDSMTYRVEAVRLLNTIKPGIPALDAQLAIGAAQVMAILALVEVISNKEDV